MQNLQFPLDFKFHIATISNDFSVTEATGQSVYYVREKMFTLKDKIKVYGDSNKSELLYELTSNRLIDFQQTFTITDKNGNIVGKARRKTLQSFWTATFHIIRCAGQPSFHHQRAKWSHSYAGRGDWRNSYCRIFHRIYLQSKICFIGPKWNRINGTFKRTIFFR
jgi:hypothetical protein